MDIKPKKQFEYKVESIVHTEPNGSEDISNCAKTLEEKLTNFGMIGWEVITIRYNHADSGNHEFIVFMKREISI